ncbi:hypothetical protein [Ekhidna sp.]|uniref:hypothetical protein n=1 Tax=Ekhidna sp. TaxID=2608089 RepID=UPI003BAB884D
MLSYSQESAKDSPLQVFDYYMGVWLLPSDHPGVLRNPILADLQVINFSWGKQKKLIHSSTGIVSVNKKIPFSEGIITVNPTTKSITWLEYQYEGDLLFEGEYIPLDNGSLQRLYTVRYVEGDKTIPNPDEPGWSRLYRETFIPFSKDTIDWVTETYIDGKWIEAGTPGGSSAVRKK